MESLDDAGVYLLSDDLAIIQTVDFFTPIVDDPYIFGQIATANALSDVYTMGGRPLTAMNIVCFPTQSLDINILKDILRGGLDKMTEAQVVLIGGHSIDDTELKYGLSVTGTVHPKKLITNSGAKPGDKLILTKPLGTGIINTAVKAGAANDSTVAKVTQSMATLNTKAAMLMLETGVSACTDITGFGLLGHAIQLAQSSQVGIDIDTTSIPRFSEADDFARQGFCPGGLHRNRDFYSPSIKFADKIPVHMQDILFDPQTSGGLLISLSGNRAKPLLDRLHQADIKEAALIGEITGQHPGKIVIR